jgi:hypothetical protein
MDCNLKELVSMVKVAMDRNMDSTALETIGDVDTLSVNDIIKEAIPKAARIVEQAAPFHLLGRGEPFTGTVYWPGTIGVGSGHIQLPDDFLRLVCFQMSDWVRPANDVITIDDPRYAMQQSDFSGIKGNPHNPVVAIVPWSTGLELEFYSCTAGAAVTVRRARYLPMPKVSGTGDAATVNISEKLQDAIVYYAAALAATSLGMSELAGNLITHSKSLVEPQGQP